MTLYYVTMTATMSMPQAKINAQDIVAANVNLMITARHLQKKDLANALGLALRSEITWTINETQAAADFLNTDVATLLNPDLSSAELRGDNKKPRGGLTTPRLFIKDLYRSSFVAGHGFEPWTSGPSELPSCSTPRRLVSQTALSTIGADSRKSTSACRVIFPRF